MMSELDEFFSYIEAPQVGENLKAWLGSYPEGTLQLQIAPVFMANWLFRLDNKLGFQAKSSHKHSSGEFGT